MSKLKIQDSTDYKRVFNSLCHYLALSQTVDITSVFDNLLVSAIALEAGTRAIELCKIQEAVRGYFSTDVAESEIQDSLLRLQEKGALFCESESYRLTPSVAAEVNQRAKSSTDLERTVKEEWYKELELLISIEYPRHNINLDQTWEVLQRYLARSFYRHGAQTIKIFDASVSANGESTSRLSTLLKSSIEEVSSDLPLSFIHKAIHLFLGNQTTSRVAYLAELLDGTFSFFALNFDDAVSSYLSGSFQPTKIFLDTNFIFGVLKLHHNPLVEVSEQLLQIIQEHFPQITLYYHSATVDEMGRTVHSVSEKLKKRTWQQNLSRAAIKADALTGIELHYHQQNAEFSSPLSPQVFIDKYQNPVPLLREMGFTIYNQTKATEVYRKGEIIADYKEFIESRRQPKTYQAYDHDVTVLLATEDNRSSNNHSILEAGSLFLTCDYYLYSYDNQHRSSNKLGSVVLPNHLLQVLRPLAPRTPDFDKRFVATFAIPEFRTIDSDYSATVSRVMMYLSGFETLSEESAARILGDRALIQNLQGVDEDSDTFANSIESVLAKENEMLLEEMASLKEKQSSLEQSNKRYDEVVSRQKAEIQEQKVGLSQSASKASDLQQRVNTTESEVANLQITLNEYKEALDSSKRREQTHNDRQRLRVNKRTEDYARRLRSLSFVIVVGWIGLLAWLIYRLTWDVMEPWTYLIGLGIPALTYLYFVVNNKKFSLQKIYEEFVEAKRQEYIDEYLIE